MKCEKITQMKQVQPGYVETALNCKSNRSEMYSLTVCSLKILLPTVEIYNSSTTLQIFQQVCWSH